MAIHREDLWRVGCGRHVRIRFQIKFPTCLNEIRDALHYSYIIWNESICPRLYVQSFYYLFFINPVFYRMKLKYQIWIKKNIYIYIAYICWTHLVLRVLYAIEKNAPYPIPVQRIRATVSDYCYNVVKLLFPMTLSGKKYISRKFWWLFHTWKIDSLRTI